MKIKSVLELIGNTPILEIDKSITGLKNVNLYVKCEYLNPFGSLKDRAAYSMLKDEIDYLKKNNMTVIESSSGNTAKAMQIICAMNDIPFKTITNRIKIPEVRDILKTIGGKIEELPGFSECPDPTSANDPITYIENLIGQKSNKYLFTNQYTNLKNPAAHYNNTAHEIYDDVGNVDYFFGALGTTGSTRGTIEYLLTKNKDLKKIGIVAEQGDHIPGIRNMNQMQEVGIFEKNLYDDIVDISSVDAVEGMLILNKKLGVLAGPTSGAAYLGTIRYLKKIDANLDKPITAVFIACDRMEWYISYIKKRKPELFTETEIVDNYYNFNEIDKYLKEINANNYLEFINNFNPLVIDLRGNYAYQNAHIKDSINFTDMYFEDMINYNIPFDKERKVLLVCANGHKSAKIAAYSNKKGLDVYSLQGGIIEYKNANLPLLKNI